MDWLYRDDSPEIFPTTQTGSQIVSWWTQKNGRSTYVHVTNTAEGDPSAEGDDDDCDDEELGAAGGDATQYVHVEILGEDCNEILNFCDVYTPEDSHIYDLDNLVSNAGQNIGSAGLDGKEGTIVITATSECAEAGPIFPLDKHNFFAATTRVIDSIETDYGFNCYARHADDTDSSTDTNGCNGAVLEDLGPGSSGDDADTEVDTLEKDFNVFTESALGANDAVAGGDIILMNFSDNNNDVTYTTSPGFTFYANPVIFDYKEGGSSCPDFTACFLRTGIDFNLPADKEFVLAPPTEDCSTPGDEDGNGFADCDDSACDSDPSCENGDEECSDGEDNDADGSTDCADAGCAGAAAGPGGELCEPAGETSCDDGADNDGDGDADGDDADCAVAGDDDDDDDDDSGGCSLVANASAGTAAVNVLLPMMVFGLVFGLRRIRRRK